MIPKKQFGQNFLTSLPARAHIVTAGELLPTDTVLEIGPGKGFLTKGILETGAHVVALEKDRDLLPLLEASFQENIAQKQLTLLSGDVLDFTPSKELFPNGYKIIANIPYYITGAIISQFLESELPPRVMVILIQKEVAERIVARDGKHSILSLSVWVYGTPSIVCRVNRGSFHPIPNVDSAVLKIDTISSSHFSSPAHKKAFFALIKAGFLHKRKVLVNNIKDAFPHINVSEIFEELSIQKTTRAEDVTLEAWLSLSLRLSTLL